MKHHSIRTVRIALISGLFIIAITCGLVASGTGFGFAEKRAAAIPASTGVAAGKAASVNIQIKIALPKPITIKFNGNGGSAGASEKTVYRDRSFGTLPKATRSGYTFTGWYTAKKGGSRIDADQTVTLTRTKTYYAHWEKAVPFGPPAPSANVVKVNINTASAARLQAITGVGPKLADTIIAYRNAHGLFPRTEDLMKVKGIGKATFEKMRNQVTV
jgi:competence ComEA-like helix-hairpin-helix protein